MNLTKIYLSSMHHCYKKLNTLNLHLFFSIYRIYVITFLLFISNRLVHNKLQIGFEYSRGIINVLHFS